MTAFWWKIIDKPNALPPDVSGSSSCTRFSSALGECIDRFA